MGVAQNTYSTWESGTHDVKSEYIPKLAELLKVDIKDLFENHSKIEINQNISDNKDNSVNGLIFILSDPKNLEEIVNTLKKNNV